MEKSPRLVAQLISGENLGASYFVDQFQNIGPIAKSGDKVGEPIECRKCVRSWIEWTCDCQIVETIWHVKSRNNSSNN